MEKDINGAYLGIWKKLFGGRGNESLEVLLQCFEFAGQMCYRQMEECEEMCRNSEQNVYKGSKPKTE